jgi:quinol monooxygenase YgiN
MPRFAHLVVAALFVVFAASSAPAADVKLANGTVLSAKPFYIVTYIEVDPSGTRAAKRLIRKHSAASKKDAGNLRYEA